MGKEFQRLKRQSTSWVLIRSVMIMLSVTLLIAGAVLLAFKLTTADFAPIIFIILGLLLGVAAGVASFLLSRRTDLGIAERIDQVNLLNERVQTMVAFRDEDTAMIQVQREDTEMRLRQVKKTGIRKTSVALNVIALVLSVAVFVTGMVVPTTAVIAPPEPTEPPYIASAWQKAAVQELIEHVQQSDMAQAAKEPTVAELQGLLAVMDGSITVSAMREKVISAIRSIYQFTDRVNSNDSMHDIISLISHGQADTLAYLMGTLENEHLGDRLDAIGAILAAPEQMKTLGDLAAQLKTGLKTSEFDESDDLFATLSAFADKLEQTAAEKDPAEAKKLLGDAIHSLKSGATLALEQQAATKAECVYVVDTLCDIFDITDGERPADPDLPYSEKEDQDGAEVGGGGGSGQIEYAGSDQVYDHEQHEHKQYGELIDNYYLTMLREELDGELSEEMLDFIRKYFDQLYVPVEDDTEIKPAD